MDGLSTMQCAEIFRETLAEMQKTRNRPARSGTCGPKAGCIWRNTVRWTPESGKQARLSG